MRPLAVSLLFFCLACGREVPAPRAVERDVPEQVEWESVVGASSYSVRGWCGARLVFEVETRTPQLELDAATRRACAQFDTLELHIRAQEPRGELIVMRLWP